MLQSRIDYIASVNDYIANTKLSLNGILDTLGWEKKAINVTDSEKLIMVPCPNDVGHRVPKNRLDEHVIKCSLHKSGYTLQDDLFPPAPSPGLNTIKIDDCQLERIRKTTSTVLPATHSVEQKPTLRPVPQTSDRLISDFTPSERLLMYDYVIKHTSSDNKPVGLDVNLPFSSTQGDSKPKTLEELLAAERDAKRRRMKYKSKNVHTSKKTQTEILREVIQSQMEGFEEWLNKQNDEVKKNTEASKSDLTDRVNFIKSDSSRVKEIDRNWDDWIYYQGNPHTRYKKVIQEERDAESHKSKVSNKRCGRDNYRDITKDDRKSRVDDDYYRLSKKKDFPDRHSRKMCRNEDYKSERHYSRDNERERHYQRNYGSDDLKRHRSYDKLYVKSEREFHNKSKEEYHRHRSRSDDKEENHGSHSSLSTNYKIEDDYNKRHKKSKKHKHKRKHYGKKHKSKKSTRKRDRKSSEDSNSSVSSN